MVETSDKLKFVGHLQRPFALLPNSPTVSRFPKAYVYLNQFQTQTIITINQSRANRQFIASYKLSFGEEIERMLRHILERMAAAQQLAEAA